MPLDQTGVFAVMIQLYNERAGRPCRCCMQRKYNLSNDRDTTPATNLWKDMQRGEGAGDNAKIGMPDFTDQHGLLRAEPPLGGERR